MVRQMLQRAIHKFSDLSVVGEVTNICNLPLKTNLANVDWVVVSLTKAGEFPSSTQRLWQANPRLNLLGISKEGNQLELKIGDRAEEKHLRNVSFEELISLLREPLQNQELWG